MEEVILGHYNLDHSNGVDRLRVNAVLKSDCVKLECKTPAYWFMRLTKAQALKLAAHINRFYGVKKDEEKAN